MPSVVLFVELMVGTYVGSLFSIWIEILHVASVVWQNDGAIIRVFALGVAINFVAFLL